MIEKTYNIQINASKEHVWDVMFGKDTYSQWAKGNREEPRFIGTWEQGTEIDFLDPDGGTRALLQLVEKPKHLLMKRTAVLGKNGEIIDETNKLIGTTEEYRLNENAGVTTVLVSTHIDPDFEEAFDEGYAACFKLLKELCERSV